MKRFRKLLISALVIFFTIVVALLIYLTSQKPKYAGTIQLVGLSKQVEVLYDFYGVPHIYASSEQDAYFALGYVHAQDRLFQMEMVRRVAGGRLAEVFGPEYVKVDAFFRTLGLDDHAAQSAAVYLKENDLPYQKAARAYLAGINQFVDKGRTPVEFVMLGIHKEHFTEKDLYLALEYLSFNFAMGFRTDALMSYISRNLGTSYYNDLNNPSSAESIITRTFPDTSRRLSALNSFEDLINKLPVPPLVGSNAWIVAPSRSHSGKVIFANDTHIGYSQPAVWYEAHLEYPGVGLYGNYAAGIPFAVLGHTRDQTWGLTMLENDDLDFYSLRLKPGDSTRYWYDGNWKLLQIKEKTINVKGGDPVKITVRSSHQGPLIQDVMPEWKTITTNPVAAWWTQLKFPSNLLQVSYALNHSTSFNDTRYAVSEIISPGLNVMYGDRSGNIAWWAGGRLIKRAKGTKANLLQDGTKHNSEPQGYYDFRDNPHRENPPQGFVFSANSEPDTMIGGVHYPGYYTPDDRALRIVQLLSDRAKYSIEDFQRMNTDAVSPVAPLIARSIVDGLSRDMLSKSPRIYDASRKLLTWNGDHQLRDIAPVIYYKVVYNVLHEAMADELGEENFKTYMATHIMKTSLAQLVENDSSVWWNDITTLDIKESRNMIFDRAFKKSIDELTVQLGETVDTWEWGRVHTVEHVHPIGMKKPFNLLFNVGPYPVAGGPEVINQISMPLTADGIYKATYGPAMRIVIDFADAENSKTVLPTGQSGNVMSRYYYDEAVMYNTNKSRKQKMNRSDIDHNKLGRLLLQPMEK